MSADQWAALYLLVGVVVTAILWSRGKSTIPESDHQWFYWVFTFWTVLYWPLALLSELAFAIRRRL